MSNFSFERLASALAPRSAEYDRTVSTEYAPRLEYEGNGAKSEQAAVSGVNWTSCGWRWVVEA